MARFGANFERLTQRTHAGAPVALALLTTRTRSPVPRLGEGNGEGAVTGEPSTQ
jgi:hypothetical protein